MDFLSHSERFDEMMIASLGEDDKDGRKRCSNLGTEGMERKATDEKRDDMDILSEAPTTASGRTSIATPYSSERGSTRQSRYSTRYTEEELQRVSERVSFKRLGTQSERVSTYRNSLAIEEACEEDLLSGSPVVAGAASLRRYAQSKSRDDDLMSELPSGSSFSSRDARQPRQPRQPDTPPRTGAPSRTRRFSALQSGTAKNLLSTERQPEEDNCSDLSTEVDSVCSRTNTQESWESIPVIVDESSQSSAAPEAPLVPKTNRPVAQRTLDAIERKN